MFGLKQIGNMHGHWFICLGEQEHSFLGSALHFIQITWFTRPRLCQHWFQFTGCSL